MVEEVKTISIANLKAMFEQKVLQETSARPLPGKIDRTNSVFEACKVPNLRSTEITKKTSSSWVKEIDFPKDEAKPKTYQILSQ